MPYEKLLTDTDGEEFPYSERLDQDGYFYKISVVFEERDGELQFSNCGAYLFFDEGGFIDFNISPESIYPEKDRLQSNELLQLMAYLFDNQEASVKYSKDEKYKIYEKYLLSRERRF